MDHSLDYSPSGLKVCTCFFKDVMRACKSHVNVTKTLAGKYISYFAYKLSSGIIPPDVQYDPSKAKAMDLNDFTEDQIAILSEGLHEENVEVLTAVNFKGIEYTAGQVLIMDGDGIQDLKVGCIENFFLVNQTKIIFLLQECKYLNSLNGYFYKEKQMSKGTFCLKTLDDLPDFYPLQVYKFQQKECISLKHSVICMI